MSRSWHLPAFPRPLASLPIAAILFLTLSTHAQSAPQIERVFSYSSEAVNLALRQLNVYEGTRLPSLEGFAVVDAESLPRFALPYSQFKVDVSPQGPLKTLVRVSARISALYRGPEDPRTEYRFVPSSGRLERDLLERLENGLTKAGGGQPSAKSSAASSASAPSSGPAVTPLEQALAARRSERNVRQMAAVRQSLSEDGPSGLLRTPSLESSQLLERARLAYSDGRATPSARAKRHDGVAAPPSGEAPPAFEIARAEVKKFTGDWAELKGKQTIFLWARASQKDPPAEARWAFAQHAFREHAWQPLPSQVEGMVIIFLEGGGIAAATMRDIRRWRERQLSDGDFMRHCSLDPAAAFPAVQPSEPKPAPNQPRVLAVKATRNEASAPKQVTSHILAPRVLPLKAAAVKSPMLPLKAGPVHVTGIEDLSRAGSAVIAITLDGSVTFQGDRISNPDRIYFDLKDAKSAANLKGKQRMANGFVRGVRIGERESNTTRLVLDLNVPCTYTAELSASAPYRLLIRLQKEEPR